MNDLLSDALAEFNASQPAPTATTAAKRTTQFTLASLPFVTIYLQGAATDPTQLATPAIYELPAWTKTAPLRYRRLPFKAIPTAAIPELIDRLTATIKANGLLSTDYRATIASMIKDYPTLWQAIGGSTGLLSKAVSPERALDAITNWQAFAASIPLASSQPEPTLEAEPLPTNDELAALLSLPTA